MKLSNAESNAANIITTILFLVGILIFLKIGFVQWIIYCSIFFFFIAKDEEFVNNLMPSPELKLPQVYIFIWLMTLLIPIVVILTYWAGKVAGYSSEDE